MKLHTLILALAATLAVLLTACGDDDDGGGDATSSPTAAQSVTASPEPAAFPLTITDDAGVEVTIDEQPDAIVALAPSFVEVLFAIGAGDTIVAADQNTDYPPEAEAIPKVDSLQVSIEDLASYEPDLAMLFFDPGGLQDALTDLDIPTVLLATPTTVDGVYDQIETIGEIAGHPEEAADVVTQMQDDIQSAVSGGSAQGISIFHELDPALFTVGPGSFPHEVYELLGVTNIAESTGEAYPQMSNEAVIAAAPDVIILTDADFGESAESVATRPGWDTIPAVVDARIYPQPGGLLTHASPRLVEDIETLAGILYARDDDS